MCMAVSGPVISRSPPGASALLETTLERELLSSPFRAFESQEFCKYDVTQRGLGGIQASDSSISFDENLYEHHHLWDARTSSLYSVT